MWFLMSCRFSFSFSVCVFLHLWNNAVYSHFIFSPSSVPLSSEVTHAVLISELSISTFFNFCVAQWDSQCNFIFCHSESRSAAHTHTNKTAFQIRMFRYSYSLISIRKQRYFSQDSTVMEYADLLSPLFELHCILAMLR